jgi:hypothetical protein
MFALILLFYLEFRNYIYVMLESFETFFKDVIPQQWMILSFDMEKEAFEKVLLSDFGDIETVITPFCTFF